MREIHADTNVSVEKIHGVAEAPQEQSLVANAIASNIEAIAQMAEESDIAVRATNGQVRELDMLAKDLHAAATKFRL